MRFTAPRSAAERDALAAVAGGAGAIPAYLRGAGLALPLLALEPADRGWLHARIAERFDTMLAAGFVDEVRALRSRGDLHPDLPAMRCVGYRQAWAALDEAQRSGVPLQPGTPAWAALRDQGIEAFVTASPFANLDVMPASPRLDELHGKLESRYKIYKLREALAQPYAEGPTVEAEGVFIQPVWAR